MSTTINNQATVRYSLASSPDILTGTSNTAPVLLQTTPNITVSKSANPTTFSVGDIITYSVVITNTGPNYLTGIRIIDNLGGGNLAYIVGSGTLTTSTQTYAVSPIATTPLTFTLQQLNIGATITLTYKCQVIFNLPTTVTNITNTVQGIGYTSTTSYSAYTNCTIEKKNSNEFTVNKSASVTTVYPSQVFNYYISLTNGTSSLATVFSITDSLPNNFTLQNAELKIGSNPTITLSESDFIIDTTNTITLPSSTGPLITVPAGGVTILTLTGYLV